MQSDWDSPMADEEPEEGHHSGDPSDGAQLSLRDIFSTLFAMQSGGGPRPSGDGESASSPVISLHDISLLLNSVGRSGIIHGLRVNAPEDDDEDDDGDDDEDEDYYSTFSTAAIAPWKGPVTTEPQPAGVELLNSGDFGRVGSKARTRRNDINLANLILNRARRTYSVPALHKEDYAAVRDILSRSNIGL
ncbi:hypothetical protein C0991_007560 [Blastosporella zonata]|nr:hypothetical protein C0991_007560 [Blastosporella zonata]